jgi:hypothetical protein
MPVKEYCYEYDALSFFRVPGHLDYIGYLPLFHLVERKEAARRGPSFEAVARKP